MYRKHDKSGLDLVISKCVLANTKVHYLWLEFITPTCIAYIFKCRYFSYLKYTILITYITLM